MREILIKNVFLVSVLPKIFDVDGFINAPVSSETEKRYGPCALVKPPRSALRRVQLKDIQVKPVYYSYYILQKNHSDPQIAKANLGG